MAEQAVIQALQQPFTVGWWYAECCIDGLVCLENEEEVDLLRSYLTANDWHVELFRGIWRTEAEARAALAEE
jgi:hypothetical protein